MSLVTENRRLFNALINSGGVRYNVYPAGAADIALTAGVGAWAWAAAYVQVVAAVTVTVDSWVYGVHVSNCAVDDFEIRVGSGAGAAETALIVIPFNGTDRSGDLVQIPYPVRIAAATRIAADARSAAGGNVVDVKVPYISAI